MLRPSKYFTIKKEDLENGHVKKREYKDLIEYWIYRQKESEIIGVTGRRLSSGEYLLYSIIACSRNKHITADKGTYLEIEGMKFTNDDTIEGTQDLDEYLNKTSRSK